MSAVTFYSISDGFVLHSMLFYVFRIVMKHL